MSNGWKIALIVGGSVALLYAVFLGLALYAGGDAGRRGGWGGSGTVGVLRLDGVVSAESQSSLFGGGGIDPIATAEALRNAEADSGVDAVVLRVNSPGGSPAASWEIYQAVKSMAKPVVVSVADVAASGAYYFSSAADVIMAAPSSEVGGIGVILSAQDLAGLYDKLGIGYTVLTKGKYKDIGNPARKMTQDEKDILSAQMDVIYRQFIADVAEGREHLTPEQVQDLATGLTYPGEEALRRGLVDKLGSYGDALDEAARQAGLDAGEYGVRDLGPQAGSGLLSVLFGTRAGDTFRALGREMAAGIRQELSAASTTPSVQ